MRKVMIAIPCSAGAPDPTWYPHGIRATDGRRRRPGGDAHVPGEEARRGRPGAGRGPAVGPEDPRRRAGRADLHPYLRRLPGGESRLHDEARGGASLRSEEHTSELQSLMRISYA